MLPRYTPLSLHNNVEADLDIVKGGTGASMKQKLGNRPLSHKQKYAIKIIFFFVSAKAMKALALNVCQVERSWLKFEEDWNQNIHFMTFQK